MHQCIGAIVTWRRIARLCFTKPQVAFPAFRFWLHKAIIGGIPVDGRCKDGFFGFALQNFDLQCGPHWKIGTIFQNSYDQNLINGRTTGNTASG